MYIAYRNTSLSGISSIHIYADSIAYTVSESEVSSIIMMIMPAWTIAVQSRRHPAAVLKAAVVRDHRSSETVCCDCKEQIRNILQQIITLYPNQDLFITLESGDAAVGRAGALLLGPNGRTGVFEVINSQNTSQYLSICSIDTIQINDAVYNDAIVYLPEPVPALTDCCADCDAVIRSLLPVGRENVYITTNTQTPSIGTVIRNEYGMIVLANQTNRNITFVSSCSIDLFIL